MTDCIYADHAATTFLSPAALDAMMPYLKDNFGNPSSIHSIGEDAYNAVEKARSAIAEIVNCEPDEIIFTSGGSEADNHAVRAIGNYGISANRRAVFTSGAEHHAVLYPVKELSKMGLEIHVVDTDSGGAVPIERLEEKVSAVGENTAGGSFMLVNNETGSIFDIRKISDEIHRLGGLVHTDAVQAVGHIPVDFRALGVDMLSLSAHKFHGPKGIGALICRRGIELSPYILGGSQERGMRAGTENVAGIVGMATALSESAENMEENMSRTALLRDMLKDGLCSLGGIINGGGAPGIISVRFDGGDGEALVRSLDLMGIAAASGAACNSKTVGVSHVLKSMGLSDREAAETVRFSLDPSNTEDEIVRIISTVRELV